MNRCGTNDGMNDHNRNGTAPCLACKEASATYMRLLRRRADLGMPMRSRDEVPGWKRRRPDLFDMAQVGPVLDAGARACA